MTARRTADPGPTPVESISHDDKRVNIPTADAEAFVPEELAAPTVTRWDKEFRVDEPTLVWRGKADQPDVLDVVTPPIYIQEKIDPRALVENLRRTAERPEDEPELTLFEEFDDLGPFEAVEFYEHQNKWANRMILGDSLQVMASLADRERLRGQVQTIYIDPPYGIKFGSNWQPRTDKRDVKDGNLADVAREVEQIKAFRDTWEDGINTYLTYLRDRLLVARELLTTSGSCFVQIGDENVHLVRSLMDEVFGSENFVAMIAYATTAGATSEFLPSVCDYVLWFGKERRHTKYRKLHLIKAGSVGTGEYRFVEEPDGRRAPIGAQESPDARPFRYDNLTSQSVGRDKGEGAASWFPVAIGGKTYRPSAQSRWKTNEAGMARLIAAGRVYARPGSLAYVRYLDDFPAMQLSGTWTDTAIAGRPGDKVYVVQTSTKVIERCVLMTTDPGDLVLDPTCGSGTTAYVAEQWGRRWITIDTSRVAIALARQRMMAARLPYYLLADSAEGAAKERSLGSERASISGSHGNDIRQGFVYERVPHITLKSIANNPDIKEGMSREEIDAAIARHAEVEYLYDRPYEDKKKVRVSGRFTVESLSPHRSVSFDPDFPSSGTPRVTDLPDDSTAIASEASYEQTILENLATSGVQNGRRKERLVFSAVDPHPGTLIQAIGTASSQADLQEAKENGAEAPIQRVAVMIGPEYGTVDARMVKAAAREALTMPDIDVLVVLGYAFEANALSGVEETQKPGFAEVAAEHRLGRLPVLLVRMNADLAMGDELLKNSSAANLFTVFGEPDIDVRVTGEGVVVEIRGIDVYDPTTGEVRSRSVTDADGIALWMIDTDYDDESFFVRHAYFSGGQDPYKKLRTALKAEIDEEAWASLYSTTSRPFPKPSTGKIAVKAINYYGDEVLVVREVG